MTNKTNAVAEQRAREALKRVKFPGYSRDIVSFGMVKAIQIEDGSVTAQISVTTQRPEVAAQIKSDAEKALREAGFERVIVEIRVQSPPQAAPPSRPAEPPRIEGVKKIVAIASSKGGVGKSTVAVNLACALNRLGRQVGLMDADIYGPSVPQMLPMFAAPEVTEEERIVPAMRDGLKIMSMGYLIDADRASIMRGPMIDKYLNLFLTRVQWAPLDILLVDMPPGTGDAYLSLAQSVALDGAVVVTTPQEVALGVTRRGMAMMQTVKVPILGIIENMSYYICERCGHRAEIFGYGGARRDAERLGVPFLGEIPIHTEIRESGDQGLPVVLSQADNRVGEAFLRVAEALQQRLNLVTGRPARA